MSSKRKPSPAQLASLEKARAAARAKNAAAGFEGQRRGGRTRAAQLRALEEAAKGTQTTPPAPATPPTSRPARDSDRPRRARTRITGGAPPEQPVKVPAEQPAEQKPAASRAGRGAPEAPAPRPTPAADVRRLFGGARRLLGTRSE